MRIELKRISAGFGLGALNDADDDDLDVYDGPASKRGQSRVAYEDDDDGTRMVMGSSRRSGKAVERVRALPCDLMYSNSRVSS